MDVKHIQKTIEQLRASIFKQISHRTLLQYTGNPFIHDKHLFFILLPILNGEKWDEQLNEGAITIGIIHASLSEHEKIDEYNATTKVQQLTVLSGDYYSGRYYEILAYSGNIQLIRQMSKAILKRCEHQMRIYEPDLFTVEQWIETLLFIETELIERFYEVYGFTQYAQIMKITLLICRLQEELQNLLQSKNSPFVKKMLEANGKTSKGLSLEMFIKKEIDNLSIRLHDVVHSSSLQDELKQYILNQVAFRQERF